jgi:hypothetical protein
MSPLVRGLANYVWDGGRSSGKLSGSVRKCALSLPDTRAQIGPRQPRILARLDDDGFPKGHFRTPVMW